MPIPPAAVGDADACQGKIVSTRIIRRKAAQRFGDLPRHRPIRCPAFRQTKKPADPGDMRIHGDGELPRMDFGPEAEINPIRRADHPAKEHIEPFTGGPGGGIVEEKSEAATLHADSGTEAGGKLSDGLRQIRTTGIVTRKEAVLERTPCIEDASYASSKGTQILRCNPAVDKTIPMVGMQLLYTLMGVGTERREETLKGRQDGRDIPKREERGEKGNNFAILGVRIGMGKLDRVTRYKMPIVSAGEPIQISTQD